MPITETAAMNEGEEEEEAEEEEEKKESSRRPGGSFLKVLRSSSVDSHSMRGLEWHHSSHADESADMHSMAELIDMAEVR